MHNSDLTHVAVLTPQGRGAIATVEVRGPLALEAVTKLFVPVSGMPLDATSADDLANRLRYGRWNGRCGEETILCVIDLDAVEIHCHGGIAAAQAIVNALVAAGCTAISWEVLLQATERDPIHRAARQALALAPTERTAAILLDQYAGALRRRVDEVLEAIDSRDSLRAAVLIDELLANARVGLHLVEPFRVVLLGAPNVGKSSLINAVMGYNRAIVHEAPGTTRDAVTATTAVDGWPIELVDTAGLRATSDPVELAGIARARAEAETADLVVFVVDRSAASNAYDKQLRAGWPTALVVHNKADLPPAAGWCAEPADFLTSATTGHGIAELLTEVVLRLVPSPPGTAAAVPFCLQQCSAIASAAGQLRAGNLAAAADCLQALVD